MVQLLKLKTTKMKKVIQFIKEVWHRLGLPSPSFFQVIQWLSMAVAFITGLPALLLQYQAQFGITFPQWVFTLSDRAVAWAAIVGFFISKLAVKDPNVTKLKSDGEVKPLLPFTNKK